MKVSSVLIEIDDVCDWIPVVSTISNLVDLFLRFLPLSCLPNAVSESRFWEHLQKKNIPLSLLIPVANIAFCFDKLYAPLAEKVEEIKKENEQLKNENIRLEQRRVWLTQWVRQLFG